jgi:hypothetical protein
MIVRPPQCSSLSQIQEVSQERDQLLQLLRDQQQKNEQSIISQQQLTALIQKRYAT